jgi:hypothetical protein
MIKAYLRYLCTFVVVYLPAFWLTLWVRGGGPNNPVELTLGWLLLLGGWLWFAALASAAPVVLLALAWRPGLAAERRGRRLWGALWSVVVALPFLAAWGGLAGMFWPIDYLTVMGPAAIVGALAAAGVALSGSNHLPTRRRVATVLGVIVFIGLAYRVVIPTFAPAFAYRYFDGSVSVPIAAKVLSEIHAGDSVAVLERRLPGFVDAEALAGREIRSGGLMGTVEYWIVMRNGLVDSIDVREASSD